MSLNLKQLAGSHAVSFVESGMKVGLGSGSTVYYTLLALGEKVRAGLDIIGIPTSERTAQIAREQGIQLPTFEATPQLDLTIDGADEFDPQLQLIKGGGGALYREKLVASISDRLIIVVDERKEVSVLGAFPLPVEVVPFGLSITEQRLSTWELKPKLRQNEQGAPYLTDNGNYILDCHVGHIPDPPALHLQLKSLVGVVETGLFIDMADLVILADQTGQIRTWKK